MIPEFFEFHNPTRVVFGPGIATDFKAELDAVGVRRYFLLADRGVLDAGIVERVKNGLDYAGAELAGEYFDIAQDAELEGIRLCARLASEAETEGLIAVGGGSVIDTAKAANILISEGGDLIEDHSGAQTLSRPLKPLVVLPTTAGTGSEVTIAAVVFDRVSQSKQAFTDKYLLPTLAVLDPELTVSLPPRLTATTAMDALTHAVEAFMSPQWSPYSDALAYRSTQLIFDFAERATAQGQDLEARGGLQIAANMAGIAFSHAMVGCVHAMAHAVGGISRVPHGLANAILLPHGMEYNLEVAGDKLSALAPAMGAPDQQARRAIEAVTDLLKRLHDLCGLPLTLESAGVDRESLPRIAEAAVMDGASFYSPRPVVAEDILVSLNRAFRL